MWTLAFRNIFRHKLRTALTLAAILFGVVGLMISGGFIEDLFFQLREFTIHSQLGHIQIYRHGYLEQGRQKPFQYMIDRPEQLVDQVKSLPQVQDVMQRIQFAGLISNKRAQYSIIGEGVMPDKETRLGSHVMIISGRPLRDSDSAGILLGEGVAGSLKLKPGDSIDLLTNTRAGALNTLEFQVVGVFRTASKEFDDRAVRIAFGSAQEFLATDGAHSLVLSLTQTSATDPVVSRLRALLAPSEFEVKPWYDLADFYRQTVKLYDRQFGILQMIVLGIVLLSVVNSVNMTTYERTGEYGTLMALGNRRERVFRLVMAEHVLLAIIGSCVGMVVGMALASAISAIGISMPPPPNATDGYTARILVTPGRAVFAAAVGFFATVLAALWPARRAARLAIVDALRQN